MNSHQRRGSWRWWKKELLAGKMPGKDRTNTQFTAYFKSRILAMGPDDAIAFVDGILELGRQRAEERWNSEDLSIVISCLHWTERQALYVVTRTGYRSELQWGDVDRLQDAVTSFLLGRVYEYASSASSGIKSTPPQELRSAA